MDPEEYSRYFPNFLWVVRDFTLQLVDDEGEPLTAREYLEKALGTQRGFTDAIEHKNRIRKLLKSFFPERDCVTLVRPMTDEKALQNLINTPLEDMRPEFAQGVRTVRKKIMQKIKPKKMHGANLNGEMLYNLACSYVDAINEGAVPNIETAWTYLCQNECFKAQETAYQMFEQEFQQQFDEAGPFSAEQLDEIFREHKSRALKLFKKVAVGDDMMSKYQSDLKLKIKKKFDSVKEDNTRGIEVGWQTYLTHNYESIEQTLKSGGYTSFEGYLADVQEFGQYVTENPPVQADGGKTIADFLFAAIQDASLLFFKSMENELRLQSNMQNQKVDKLERDLKEIKGDNIEKIEQLESKLQGQETNLAQTSAREMALRENVSTLSNEKQQLEAELNAKIEDSQRDSDRQLEEYSTRF